MESKDKQTTQKELDKLNKILGEWLSDIVRKAGDSCQLSLTVIENQIILDQVIRLIKTKKQNYNEEIDDEPYEFKPFKLDILKKSKIKIPNYLG